MSENEKLTKADEIDKVTRRQFLEILGASFAAAAAAGCKVRPPKERIVAYLDQPEEVVPGASRWYASTCSGCSASCGVLVKSRDGRPIKMEGNPDHPLSRGGLCARGQATVLDLYDSERLRQPLISGLPASWGKADSEIRTKLDRIQRNSGSIRIVTSTLTGPSESEALAEFMRRYPNARHIVYDALSSSSIIAAHRLTHGRGALPHYHFDRAKTIVSFDADFLGTWISPVEFTKDWAGNRQPDSPDNEWDMMSWHAQFESRMSITGANADLRVPIRPSEELATVIALGRMVAVGLSWKGVLPPFRGKPGASQNILTETANMLIKSQKRSLVVSGSPDVAVQATVNWINQMLGNYGATVDIEHPSLQRQGNDAEMNQLIGEMTEGKVSALIIIGANPAYDHPRAEEFAQGMKRISLTIALAEREDETASLARYACPTSHLLESWGDSAPTPGIWSLRQPVLAPLFDTRTSLESLLAWAGKNTSAYDFIREHWLRHVYPKQKKHESFTGFWDEALRQGAVTIQSQPIPMARFNSIALADLKSSRQPAGPGELEMVSYPNVALADGRQANNPWLQEMPDPVSKVAWGNFASFSPSDAKQLRLTEGTVVRLSSNGRRVELPAHIQPGMSPGVVAAALGYGRKNAGKIAANYPMVKMLPIEKDLLSGADLFPFLRIDAVGIEKTRRKSPLAKSQTYDFQTDPVLGQKRPMVQETTLQDYYRDPQALNSEIPEGKGMWPRHEYTGHKWGMAVNLNSCTGCNACVVACQAENNVPVVGKAEVRKNRDMAWIRIDRYYSGTPDDLPQSPDVAFQPMLCQHCDNAPCETVCPVLATVHSTEGLNMQVYNRCVGTRYCANNCPYKVRRFNWFDYAHQDLLQNLALNPDVTVRSRGVMEKCTFCTQRIYSSKFQAQQEGREIKDGDVKPACVQSCPAEALVFGDLNDPNSRVSKMVKEPRSYRVLAELGVGPSVIYQTKVRNKKVL